MSANVDERIVQMQFDNQQFEARAQNTITTLNALTQALQLPTASTKGFDQIQTAANTLNFNKLDQALDTINYRFSAFGIMATNVLNRISDAAINMGKKLVDSVTMEPLRSGFSEYETKMESVKRILNSAKNEDGTAVSLAQVNEKLDELNTYADKTIYNFMDMTQNIGKFTNAGVDLDKSVKAIQGIANEAALAGANSQEASRAMYNFAQALSSGYVKLIDWKSIENANMATVGFKEQLLETALALGTVRKEGDKYVTTTTNAQGKISDAFDATQGFNDALAHQWMTADVLTETLAKYADETTEIGKAAFKAATEVTTFSKLIDTLKEALGSGWTETWQLVIGDFEEAKQLWTAVNDVLSDVINTTANSRNEMFGYWKEWGGRQAIIEGLGNAFHALITVLRPIKRAFNDILMPFHNTFSAASGLTLLSHRFKEFTNGLILHYPIQRKIWVVAKGVFSAFDLLGQVVSAVWRTIQPIFGVLKEVFEIIAKRTVRASKSFTEFVAHLKETDAIYNGLQKLVGILQKVADVAFNVAKSILGFFGIKIETKDGATFIETITSVFETFSQNPHIQNGITLLGNARDAIVNFVTGIRDSEKFQAIAAGLATFGNALARIGSTIKGTVVTAFTNITNAIKELFKNANITGFSFDTLFDVGLIAAVGVIFKKLHDILKGDDSPVSIIRNFFKDLSSFKEMAEKAAKSFKEFGETITAPLKELTNSIKADVLLKIAKAIGILAASILVLSFIDPGKLGVSILAIGALMAELTTAATALGKFNTGRDARSFAVAGASMMAFAGAIGILAIAAAGLSKIDPDKLRNGVIAIGILMGLATLMSKLGGKNFSSKGLLGMSVAILLIQIAIKQLAKLDQNALANALNAVFVLMAVMTAMSRFGGKNFSGAGMIAVAAAILILQKTIKSLGEMDTESLIKGIGAVSALMVFMGLFSRLSGKNALTASVGTIAIAYAMGILQKVIADFGAMDTAQLGQGLMTVGLSLAAMAAAMAAMTGSLAGAAALVVATLALKMLVPIIQALTELDFVNVLKGVASFALVVGALVVAGAALGAVVPSFLAFGGALVVIGAGAALLGVGLLAAGAGLAAIAASAVVATASIIASVAMVIAAMIEQIPFVVTLVTAGINAILNALAGTAVTIAQVVVRIGLALIEALRSLLPSVVQFLFDAQIYILTFLGENAPTLVSAFVEMAINVIDGLAQAIYDNTDRLIEAVHHVLGAIIDFILATLQEILGGLPAVGGKISEAIGGIREEIAKDFNKEEGEKQGRDFGEGIGSGISSSAPKITTETESLSELARRKLSEGFKGASDEVGDILSDKLTGAISNASGDTNAASLLLGESGVDSIVEGFGDLNETGFNVDLGLANGILDNQGLVTDAAEGTGLSILDAINMSMGIESPSTKTWESGKYLDEGLANGISENEGVVTTAIQSLGTFITGGFNTLVTAFSKAGSKHGTLYAQGLVKGTGSAKTAGTVVATSASSALASILPKFGQNGTTSGTLYASSVHSTSGIARVAGSTVGSSAATGLGTAKTAFASAGVSSGSRYVSGVRSKSGDARSAGSTIGTSAANGAKNVGGFYDAGRDSSQGYIDGLLSRAKQIASAAANLVRDALNAARNAIDSHSPSRKWEQLGVDSDEGYINGVKKRSGKVNSTMDTLATNAMGAFWEGLSRANAVATDELTVTPTVSPVMDLNNVYGGIDFLRSVFNGAGDVLGSITADVSNNVEDIRLLVNNTNKILAALNGRKPITIDGKTVIGWVDTELGAL